LLELSRPRGAPGKRLVIRYAEALLRAQPPADERNAKAIAELRALYAKASPD
jgi:hypothetical protein